MLVIVNFGFGPFGGRHVATNGKELVFCNCVLFGILHEGIEGEQRLLIVFGRHSDVYEKCVCVEPTTNTMHIMVKRNQTTILA